MKHDAARPVPTAHQGRPTTRPDRRGRAGRRRRPVQPRLGPGPEGRDRRRAVRADAHARSGEPLLDLGDLGAPPRLRSAARRHQRRRSSCPALAEIVAARQQHHVAVQPAQGRHASTTARPSRPTASSSRSSGVRDNTQADQVASSTRTSRTSRRTATSRSSVTTKRPFGSLPAHLTMLGMLPPSAAARTRRHSSRSRSGTGPFRFVSWTHGDHIALGGQRELLEAGHPARSRRSPFRFIPELSTRAAAPARGRDPRDRSRVARHGRRRSRSRPGVRRCSTRRPSRPSAGSSSSPRSR